MYQRKTKDVWQLWTSYDGGITWDCEVEEETRQAIKQRAKEYRLNTQSLIRIEKHREKIEEVI